VRSTISVSQTAAHIGAAVFIGLCLALKSQDRDPVVPGYESCLLSEPSKMPGPSWSLPAHESCPRACGTVCADCYAEKGSYQFASTVSAQGVRFAWTRECLRTPAGQDLWVRTMVLAILRYEYFRVHDSGDMFNPTYARMWLRVCRALPGTKFWIPTKSWQQPGGVLPMYDPLLGVLRELARLDNVTVRPSALNFGDRPPVVPGLHAGASAGMDDMFRAYQCPAKAKYDGNCGPCRHCWDVKDCPVNYPHH